MTFSSNKKIGIIAGNGDLPNRLASVLTAQGYIPIMMRLGVDFSVGQAGAIIQFFRQNDVKDLVMVGGLDRPNWLCLKTDAKGFWIVLKVMFRMLGDDGLLRVIRQEIESEGFLLHGIHYFMPELLAPSGVLTKCMPNDRQKKSIRMGFHQAKIHGAADLGQAIVMSGDSVIAKESKAGTNALIKSVAALGRDKILIKVSKPQQDTDIDLPTIGVQTVELAFQCGFKGIVLEEKKSLILDQSTVVKKCNELDIFLIGSNGSDI